MTSRATYVQNFSHVEKLLTYTSCDVIQNVIKYLVQSAKSPSKPLYLEGEITLIFTYGLTNQRTKKQQQSLLERNPRKPGKKRQPGPQSGECFSVLTVIKPICGTTP
jgi:hypothetical protein